MGIGFAGHGSSVSAAPGELIRLHVIANSDSETDQAVKLAVRDALVEYLGPKLRAAADVNAARMIVAENRQALQAIAATLLSEHGMDYGAHVELGEFEFPMRTYGALVLPAGRYEAVRVVLGNGSGRNWWCVLFPPLCFIDGTTNAVAASAMQDSTGEAGWQVEYRLRLVEWWKNRN